MPLRRGSSMVVSTSAYSNARSALSDTMEMAPLGLLVIQPSPFCNIDCSYCYLGDRSNQTRMTNSTVNAVVRFLSHITFAKHRLPVVWHAGEPLTVPISFYEQAFECFDCGSPPIPAEHHFQTNATLLND